MSRIVEEKESLFKDNEKKSLAYEASQLRESDISDLSESVDSVSIESGLPENGKEDRFGYQKLYFNIQEDPAKEEITPFDKKPS